MKFITPGSLFVALLMSAPEFWRAWSDSSVDISNVLLRFVLAVLLASVGMSTLRSVIVSYKRGIGRSRRRSLDLLPFSNDIDSGGTR